jgi:two-component system, cell cycle sensor histidine kinase and response regulator CckA
VGPVLRALVIEDREEDAELIVRELRRFGYDPVFRRVDDAESLKETLRRDTWDVILSDYSLPRFSAPAALALLRESGLDLPFIVVTGFIGEEQAASMMKAGANDFLVKDRLFRLGPVIERELKETRQRRDRDRELRQKQEELLQAQKMEAVARLAGGIAHDFNNLLSVILGFADVLERRLPAEERLRRPATQIRHAAERAALLTRQLLAFSRNEVPQPQVLDLNGVVTGVHQMLERVIGEDVELRLRLGHDIGAVFADPGQVEQVVMNLAVNARDAMPRGGLLALETASARLPDGGGVERPAARLTVADTGTGIAPEVMARLFEPFFTTKGAAKGTGLGLPTVQGIVKQCGGRLDVETEPGKGTAFHVLLPCVDAPAVPAPAPPRERAPLAAGTETILLVEDEPAVRALLAELLQEAGYRVREAGTARAAEAEYAAHPRVDLVLTDVVLPDRNGRELFESLSAKNPGLRVLFMSGYTDDEVLRQGLPEGIPLVRKPMRPDELLRMIRGVLEKR